jgi:hypothetical protein
MMLLPERDSTLEEIFYKLAISPFIVVGSIDFYLILPIATANEQMVRTKLLST